MEREASPPPRDRPPAAAEEPAGPREREPGPEPDERPDAPGLRISVNRPEERGRSWAHVGVVATLVVLALVLRARLVHLHPLAGTAALALAVTGLLDLLVLGPALALARRFRAEGARLRAALACPYCKDALPDDEAVACDRDGCGAFYHPECWSECRASYGGCAIYGCGSTTGHPVGEFALRRHVLRLLVAAVFFTPRVVRRLQETERQRVRDVWRHAARVQEGISQHQGKTCLSALVNAGVSVGSLIALVLATNAGLIAQWVFALSVLPLFVLPVVLIRLPLLATFGWGASRLVARAFRDELAALGRADQGTFLARLAGGAGKKDGG